MQRIGFGDIIIGHVRSKKKRQGEEQKVERKTVRAHVHISKIPFLTEVIMLIYMQFYLICSSLNAKSLKQLNHSKM